MANYSILPQPDILKEAEYGKFVLTNLAAKRAMQIKEGAPPLVRIDSSHPLSIALAEIAAGKIKPLMGEEVEEAQEEETQVSEEFNVGGLLLPGIDEESDLVAPTGDDSDNSVAATSTSLLANLLGADDEEEEAKPDSESNEISLEDLAAQEEKSATEEVTE